MLDAAPPPPAFAETLDWIARLFDGDYLAEPPLQESLAAARRRAQALATTAHDPGDASAARLAALSFAAEALAATWLDRSLASAGVDELVERLADGVGLDRGIARVALFTRAISERHVLDLSPRVAAEAVLDLFCAFTSATEASLWTQAVDGRVVESVRTRGPDSSRRARVAAREAIATGHPVTSARSRLHAVPVERWGEPAYALVFRCSADQRPVTLAYAAEAAIALAPLVEFDALLTRNAARERTLTEASERRLARVGFDLHDGAMQDLAALAADLRLFRRQIAPLLEGRPEAALALGRIDDLQARLVGLDGELRDLARSLQSPAALRVSLVEAIRQEVATFERRSSIAARLTVNGEFDALTASQKIALLRVAQEALSNVEEHSRARSAEVTVTATRGKLAVEITDDGSGFDVQQRLLEAARGGRLGLVGMGERVRLLGGRFDVESRAGGPTRVKAVIPRWSPVDGGGGGAAPAAATS